MSEVSRHVAGKFFYPETSIVRRGRAIRAPFVLMPKAAMNKNYCLIFCEHNVRPAGQLFTMKTKAVAHPM